MMEQLRKSWERHLKARNLSDQSVQIYCYSVRYFFEWLGDREVTRWTCEEYISHLLETRSASTAIARFKAMKLFFDWCVEEEELEVSPMKRIRPPHVPEKPVPLVTHEETQKLLEACNGKKWRDRRDLALISLMADTGIRHSECVRLGLDDVDLDARLIFVLGKGRKKRIVPFGRKTSVYLDRWLRVRPEDSHNFFGLGISGMDNVLQKRMKMAGLSGIHWHRFRHTFVHEHLVSGGNEGDLMVLAGWKSRTMLSRYASSRAQERSLIGYSSTLDRNVKNGK